MQWHSCDGSATAWYVCMATEPWSMEEICGGEAKPGNDLTGNGFEWRCKAKKMQWRRLDLLRQGFELPRQRNAEGCKGIV